jgi:stage V sporulation protein B
MRTVGVAFNAYVSSSVGAESMGLYTLVFSVYGFLITFATSGIGLGTMRLCAEAMGKGDPSLLLRSLRRCLLYAAVFGSVASLFILFLARPIGITLLGDVRTVSSLRLFSLSLLPIALSSVFQGYFNAVSRSAKNALTGVFEQALRIGLTVLLLALLLPRGIEYACIALVGGGCIAEVFSAFFAFLQFRFDQRKRRPDVLSPAPKGLWRKLLSITLPVSFSTYVRSGLTTVEHVLIPRCLGASGQNPDEALASYGAMHGMAIPILLYPAGILSSFTGLLLPEVAESLAKGETRRVRYVAERSITLAFLFSFIAAAVLYLLSGALGDMVYQNAEAGTYVMALVPLVPIMYLDTTVDNLLKGIGEQFYCMCVNVADAGLSVLLVLLLLPRFGAIGYVGVLILSELFNFTLSAIRLHKRIPFRLRPFRDVILPGAVAALGAGATAFLFRTAPMTVPLTVCKGVTGILLILVLYLLTGILGRERLSFFRKIFSEEPLTSRPKKGPKGRNSLDKRESIL